MLVRAYNATTTGADPETPWSARLASLVHSAPSLKGGVCPGLYMHVFTTYMGLYPDERGQAVV